MDILGPGSWQGILTVGCWIELLATNPITDEQAAALTAAMEAVNNSAPGDYRRLDVRFHLTIAEASGNRLAE